MTVGSRGARRTVGVPGTGLYWYDQSGGGSKARGSSQKRSPTPRSDHGPHLKPEDRLNLGFFKRLFIDAGEEAFVDGLREYVADRPTRAYHHLKQAEGIADASFIAGLLAVKRRRDDQAEQHFNQALAQNAGLGKYLRKYGIDASANLYITEHVAALIGPDIRGVRLALAEIYQDQDRSREAIQQLKKIYQHDPQDTVIRLSLAELLIEDDGGKRSCKEVVRLAQDVDNASFIHAALLLYKARALRRLGLPTAARDALTTAFRRKKDRPPALLRQIQYDRALVYHELGRKSRSRSELEKIYAEDPDFEDVAGRLELQ